jgi:biopolymer transport protein ExbB/TolQ
MFRSTFGFREFIVIAGPPGDWLGVGMASLLGRLSELATPCIAICFALHLFTFLVLWNWSRRDLRRIAGTLDGFTRELHHRSVLDVSSPLSEQIDAFLADINEVLENPARTGDRRALLARMDVLDENRTYLQSLRFETAYNVCRTMIEAYPMAGILGTVLAIGAVLQQADPSVSALVTRFGESIWATFSGLLAAMILMFWNSLVETRFSRLAENRLHVRETVMRAKRVLSLSPGEPS